MHSLSMGQGCSSSSSGAPSGSVVQVCFPSSQASVLDSLNRQREEGQLCDLSIQVQGQVFKAHRCVLAASSPYFHDQVLLKNMSTVSIPAVMDPLAFESVLSCAYTGQLRMLREDIVNYLTVGSVLQMWHIVDKCTELLKEGRVTGSGSAAQGVIGGAQGNPGCSSSESSLGAGSVQAGGSNTQPATHPPSRPSLSESQSPSSTNYFSPRDTNFGGGAAAAGAAGEGGVNSTPSYCTPSGGEEAFLIEEEDEEEEEELLYHRKRGSSRRKPTASVSDQEVGVSDSFGVSSYQDGDASPLQKRPTYSQPSIMPRKQWVVVKTERPQDDDLIVVSGEEGPDEEEERELEMLRERERTFNISNIRTLSGELSSKADHEMETQMDYCQSSEDYLKFDSGLMDQTPPQHLHDSAGQSGGRTVSALLGQVQSAAAARAQLFPIDMQGNQILMYRQSSLDSSQPIGMGGGMAGAPFKGPNLEHGAVHLSAQGGLAGGLDGLDGGGGGSSGKVFMCHCGKTFTHKSMRDRHINMHLDLRPFNCPVCAKKFKMKHHLTEHMKTHTGLKPYDCHGCGKKFMWRDSFMRHRSHCEGRSGAAGRSEDGGGSDRTDGISPQHLPHVPLSTSESGHGVVGGRNGISVLSPHHSSTGSSSNAVSCLTMASSGVLLGVNSQSVMQVQGSSVFGLGVSRGGCEEEVCEVGANDSVT
ncbi:zinc finger and BTB domain-containing protein 22-like [Salvelinus namaycush]|uniref:Zinc finger and BTB domain-containing protein 22-like n=1 Tax=Salvelinus namaycush TaxID=8040 RepID=A0A8U0PM07_SALNM|nr:zinc finger and BTB domain-containing protein 22-like [Salvelinus namaycush]